MKPLSEFNISKKEKMAIVASVKNVEKPETKNITMTIKKEL